MIIFSRKARKLSILSTSLDIFDIRQHYKRILYKSCRFHENLITNADLSYLNGYFSLTYSPIFFFKIYRVGAIDYMDKLCKFDENPTKNVNHIA